MKYRYKKQNVSHQEYFIQEWCYFLLKSLNKNKDTAINIKIPRIFNYNEDKKELTMQKIYGDNLANIYGEGIENIPVETIETIRKFVTLLNSYLVEYIDITGYNFMLDKSDNLWIIDFEHSKCKTKDEEINEYLREFINGENKWNPDFE